MEKIAVGNLVKTLAYVGSAAAGGGLAYGLGKGLDYNPVEKGVSLASGALGGMVLPHMLMDATSKMPKALAVKMGILAMIGGELAPASLRFMRSGIESQKAVEEAAKASKPGWVTPLLAGAAGATAITAAPALYNISRAAKRIGDGRAMRMSTSIRKRPGDPNDLRIEVMSPAQADEAAAEEKARLELEKKQQQESSMLGGLLG